MATTIQIGKCPQCDQNNVKTFTNCRACGVLLPWAKGSKAATTGESIASAPLPPWAVLLLGGLVVVALLAGGGYYLSTASLSFDSSSLAGVGAVGVIAVRILFRRILRMVWDSIWGT